MKKLFTVLAVAIIAIVIFINYSYYEMKVIKYFNDKPRNEYEERLFSVPEGFKPEYKLEGMVNASLGDYKRWCYNMIVHDTMSIDAIRNNAKYAIRSIHVMHPELVVISIKAFRASDKMVSLVADYGPNGRADFEDPDATPDINFSFINNK